MSDQENGGISVSSVEEVPQEIKPEPKKKLNKKDKIKRELDEKIKQFDFDKKQKALQEKNKKRTEKMEELKADALKWKEHQASLVNPKLEVLQEVTKEEASPLPKVYKSYIEFLRDF